MLLVVFLVTLGVVVAPRWLGAVLLYSSTQFKIVRCSRVHCEGLPGSFPAGEAKNQSSEIEA
jgi:hypothetical protein